MKGSILLLILFISFQGIAQDYPRKDLNPSHLVDEIFASQNLDISYQDLYENFLQLISHPLNLNDVTDEQFRSLYILKQDQISAFFNFRNEVGPFISVYELQNIFDRETFLRIIPFVYVPDAAQSFNKSIFKRIISEPNNYLLLRYGRTTENQIGYTETASPSKKYLGSPDNFYARFRVSRVGDFSLGATLKKDAGEKLEWNPTKKYYGFDYLSFHIQALNKGRIKNLILGDYQAQFGQGIVLGSFFGIGKNGEAVITMRKANLGFLPYSSTYEASYFRGTAISYSLTKNFTLHTMASSRGRDGSLQQDTTSSSLDFISSINYTGLHRTATEISNRNAITENNFASVLQFKKQAIDAGLIFHHTAFDVSMKRTPSIYNQFSFNGNANTNVGAYLNYNFNNYSFFSEFAQTLNNGRALVAGILASLTSKLDATIVYRKFDKDFYSFYSNAIAENSVPQNESGVYWGWKYSFNKKYSVAGYFDLFTFPWLKYRVYSPSDGSDWLLRFNFRPTKTITLFLQAKEEIKARNTGVESNLYFVGNGTKKSYLINCEYLAHPQLSFQTRLQFSNYSFNGMTTSGTVIAQDASFDFGRWAIAGRYAIFDTDDYDNRFYVYERDAWLNFTLPAYYGKGIRNYLILHYRITKKIDVWLRWSHTQYFNQETIGSGGDVIQGDSRNDVKFQARIRF
ncbi:MAG: hypothetical protein QM734_10820 [Cyclobacteriaceae bacterium]